MINAILEGAILGITLAFLIGPGFVALIHTSINDGFKSGIMFALGIAISDITLISLSYLGAIQLLQSESNQFYVGFAGGLLLIGFGIITFFRKYKVSTKRGIEIKVSVTGGGQLRYALKGYFLNILNPFLLVFWLGVMSFVSARYGVGTKEVVSFFTSAIITVFVTDSLKSLAAVKIRRFLTIGILTWVNRIVGISLMIFGIVMLARVVINYTS